MIHIPPSVFTRYEIATGQHVRSWSFGAVRELHSSSKDDWASNRGTLWDQGIFGSFKLDECACGKYSGEKHRGMICDRCGVKVPDSELARRNRFGHIDLVASVPHPLGRKGELLDAIPVMPAVFVDSSAGLLLTRIYEKTVQATNDQNRAAVVRLLQQAFELLVPIFLDCHDWNISEADTFAMAIALRRRDTC